MARTRNETVSLEPLVKHLDTLDIPSREELAERVGMSAKWLRGMDPSGGPTDKLPLHLADRLLVALGSHLYDVYPELGPDWDAPPHEVTLAWCPRCTEHDPESPRFGEKGTLVVPADDGRCLWCDTQTGGSEGSGPRRTRSASEATVREVRRRYLLGEPIPWIARDLLAETSYANASAFTRAMYHEFAGRGWALRSKHDACNDVPRQGRRCAGTTTAGQPCARFAVGDTAYCIYHDPSHAEVVRSRGRHLHATRQLLPRQPMLAWLKPLVAEHGLSVVARHLDMPGPALWQYIYARATEPADRRRAGEMLSAARKSGLSDATLTSVYGSTVLDRESKRASYHLRVLREAA